MEYSKGGGKTPTYKEVGEYDEDLDFIYYAYERTDLTGYKAYKVNKDDYTQTTFIGAGVIPADIKILTFV